MYTKFRLAVVGFLVSASALKLNMEEDAMTTSAAGADNMMSSTASSGGNDGGCGGCN